jgi:hypothetical protein
MENIECDYCGKEIKSGQKYYTSFNLEGDYCSKECLMNDVEESIEQNVC